MGSQPGGFGASAPVVPDSFGFLIEAQPAPGGGIDQRLDFDDVWVIGEGGEVALWRGNVASAKQKSGGRELGGREFGGRELGGRELGGRKRVEGSLKPTYIYAGR